MTTDNGQEALATAEAVLETYLQTSKDDPRLHQLLRELAARRKWRKICFARKRGKPDHERCLRNPTAPADRCKFHGGETPRGAASTHWRGKGYSRHVPTRYLEAIERGDLDPGITSLAPEITVHVARHAELLSRLSTGDTGELYRTLITLLATLRARHDDVVAGTLEAEELADDLTTLEGAVREAVTDEKIWKEISANSLTLGKLARTEHERDKILAKTVSDRQWRQLFGALQGLIMTHVTDTTIRARFAEALERMGAGMMGPVVVEAYGPDAAGRLLNPAPTEGDE